MENAHVPITLRNQVRLAAGTIVLLWLMVHALVVGLGNLLEGWEFWTFLLAVMTGIVATQLLARRALWRYQAALGREDLPTAKRQYEMLRDFWGRRGGDAVKSYGINLLILEGRYRDALEQLQALDTKRLGKNGSRIIEVNIAGCLVQLGEPAKALEMVEPALPELEAMGPDAACSGHLVVGSAYVLHGKPEKAISHLVRAKSTNSPFRKSAALFYLGEAYAALGKSDEARLAYQEAHGVLPNGRYGTRALERIRNQYSDSQD